MSTIINLFGLNEQQRWLAQQLWLCQTLDEVRDLRDAVDEDLHHDIILIMELIYLGDVDNLVISESDCPDVVDIMEKIRSELDEPF